ncbi:MAG: hypothetical protein GY801_33630 [bacterium]|nr:hypothetical protein [bacterium]
MSMQNVPFEEILGMIGGGLFFTSWLLQAWETKKAGESVVSFNFFLLRFIASSLLLLEAIRVRSVSLIFVMGGTILLIVYNMYMIKRKQRA